LAIAPSGQLMVTMTEKGVRTPARLQVRGVSGTANPEWGEDPDDGAALNVVDSRTGITTMPVPPGKYRVLVDRGFEYSVFEKTVDVTANQTTYVTAEIERAIQTPGWVSADLHLHSEPSYDAPQSLDERVVSLVVAGVEVGVATDHNRVTDYRPAIERLGLQRFVASVVGNEVTTEEMGFGHFNIFPLEPGATPIAYRRTNPAAIFDAARSQSPFFKDTVIQVNHPRMGDIGYFDILRLDRDRIPDLTGRAPWARLDFDAIEIFNGDDAPSVATVEGVMKDWYALLDGGYRITATGNSDSHRAIFHEPGLPRTYVRVPSDDVEKLDQRAFIESVRKNRAIVSSGPFVTLRIDEAGIGDSVAPGLRRARVEVSAPRWMEISYVEIIQKGKSVARIEAPFEPTTVTAELEATLDLRAGDWVIATAGGTKEMDPLFRRGIPPFAFTNPIFVDAGPPAPKP
ncbi:MAG: CehA/McbA family metallohydrolase, partial [Myxococcales bacterium]|nr:CehA/McbA family metallohydrolase [Myxococcales bacterium]